MEVTCELGEITTATTSECVDHATCNDGQCDCDEGYSGSGTTECVQTFCTYNFDGVDTTMQVSIMLNLDEGFLCLTKCPITF